MLGAAEYFSATVLGTGNNNGIYLKAKREYIFKSRYKLRLDGKYNFKLFFANIIETTGTFERNTPGGEYTIKEAFAETGGERTDIYFDGGREKHVLPKEEFETDEFSLKYARGSTLVLTFKVAAGNDVLLPTTNESASTGRIFEDGLEIFSDNHALRPYFIGAKKPFEKAVGFLGDSITQGTRTGVDRYEAWAHRIGNSLDESVSFLNIGMGWSRAYDAADGGFFLKRAAMCDEVFVCFGVNDIRSGRRTAEEIIEDLKTIGEKLSEMRPGIKVRFLTVPPFNMLRREERERQRVNEFIRGTKEYFDIAKALDLDGEGRVNPEFMADKDDSHPNGKGGKAVFDAFLEWRLRENW